MHPFPVGSVLLAYAVFAIGAVVPTQNVETTCKVAFDGDRFLAAASQRGLEPERRTACDKVSISDNAFYAMPLSSCELFFGNATWLTGKARFQNLRGNGGFTAHVTKDGLEVRIKPSGGFYLKQVTIMATGMFSSCKAVSLDDVLGDG